MNPEYLSMAKEPLSYDNLALAKHASIFKRHQVCYVISLLYKFKAFKTDIN
ncbi:hypothetical protein DFP80_104176 [Marinomonas rhizomae]|uniref:Uncharacterized protein n=1 Tax=Marinomonas rhizomae TaxID=491948 RepID=A0A366JBD7_9GAMM|nr:hypothetical protein DFP80_104176 [Marinomonas rhizomae]